jgi:hypothetical protein
MCIPFLFADKKQIEILKSISKKFNKKNFYNIDFGQCLYIICRQCRFITFIIVKNKIFNHFEIVNTMKRANCPICKTNVFKCKQVFESPNF